MPPSSREIASCAPSGLTVNPKKTFRDSYGTFCQEWYRLDRGVRHTPLRVTRRREQTTVRSNLGHRLLGAKNESNRPRSPTVIAVKIEYASPPLEVADAPRDLSAPLVEVEGADLVRASRRGLDLRVRRSFGHRRTPVGRTPLRRRLISSSFQPREPSACANHSSAYVRHSCGRNSLCRGERKPHVPAVSSRAL